MGRGLFPIGLLGGLYYDADGSDGGSAAQLVVTLVGAPGLSASDFLVM